MEMYSQPLVEDVFLKRERLLVMEASEMSVSIKVAPVVVVAVVATKSA